MRRPLRNVLFEAWKHIIETDYVSGRINSEGSLQASFWAALNERLDRKTRRLFVEPRFDLGDGNVIKPDLVITNTRSVIAVVELKYQPKRPPSVAKDIRSLSALSGSGGDLLLQNSRYRGDLADTKAYAFSKKTLYVWAGVYRNQTEGEPASLLTPLALSDCFVALHAVTSAVGLPSLHLTTG